MDRTPAAHPAMQWVYSSMYYTNENQDKVKIKLPVHWSPAVGNMSSISLVEGPQAQTVVPQPWLLSVWHLADSQERCISQKCHLTWNPTKYESTLQYYKSYYYYSDCIYLLCTDTLLFLTKIYFSPKCNNVNTEIEAKISITSNIFKQKWLK